MQKNLFKFSIILFSIYFINFTQIGHVNSEDPHINDKTEIKKILFLGDSLTAGYGINPEFAYPSIIQEKISDKNLPYTVINAGVSGDTSAGGLRRMDWLFNQNISIIIIALGANDGLRGFSPDTSKSNLKKIIDKSRKFNPEIKIVLTGMLAPPNMGEDYAIEYKNLFEEVRNSKEIKYFLPFLLEGVAAEPELNLADGIHPNIQGHQKIANNVWEVLEPLLEGNVAK